MAQGIWTPGGGFDRQPQGPVEVDCGNPISRGLVVAFDGERVVCAPYAGVITAYNASSLYGSRKITQDGTSLNWDTGDISSSANPLGGSLSSATLATFRVTQGGSPTAQNTSVGIGGSNQFLLISDRFDLAGDPVQLYIRGTASDKSVSSTTTLLPGTKYSTIGVYRPGTEEKSLWVNGVKEVSSSVDWGSLTPTRFVIGADPRLNHLYPFKGSINSSFIWNRALSDAEIASISANPWQLFRDDTSGILIFDMGGTAGPTVLVANPGTLSASGQANTFLRSLRLSADPGTLGLAGQAATLVVGAVYPLAADPGALSLAGQVATLVVNRITPVLVADPGALSLAGQQVSTLYSRSVVANPGSLGLTGQAATLAVLASNLLVANPGALSLAGQAAELVVNRVTPVLVAVSGALALAGQQASTLATRLLVASPGSLSLAGQQATTAASRRLVADPGGFVLLGMAASLGNGLGVSNVYVKVGGAYVAASALRVKQGGVYVGGQAFVKQGGLYLPVMT